jgi:HK97 gp10 family phage protein
MQPRIKLVGMKEVEKALGRVKTATARSKGRKILKEAGEPIARAARNLAPRDEYDLAESIDVSPVLNKSQRRKHRKGSFADVEMHIGPSGLPQGVLQEFGTFKEPAQPFMRPAWEGNKMQTLELVSNLLWLEIQDTVK